MNNWKIKSKTQKGQSPSSIIPYFDCQNHPEIPLALKSKSEGSTGGKELGIMVPMTSSSCRHGLLVDKDQIFEGQGSYYLGKGEGTPQGELR